MVWIWMLWALAGWMEGGVWARVGPFFMVPNPDPPHVHFLDAPNHGPFAAPGGWMGMYFVHGDPEWDFIWGVLFRADLRDVWYGRKTWNRGPYILWAHAFRYGPSVGLGVEMLVRVFNFAFGGWFYPVGPRRWTLRMGTQQTYFLDIHHMRAWGDLEVSPFTFSLGVNLCRSCENYQVWLALDRFALQRYTTGGETEAIGLSMVGSSFRLAIGKIW